MPEEERIVALGLLTAADLALLGPRFHRLYRVDETPCFEALLQAVDEADRALREGSRATGSGTADNGRLTGAA